MNKKLIKQLKDFWDGVCFQEPHLKVMCHDREFNKIISQLKSEKK